MKKMQSTKEFVEMYKAALSAKLTYQELAWVLEILPKSVERRRIKIKHEVGVDLQKLESSSYSVRDSEAEEPSEEKKAEMDANLLEIRNSNDKFKVKENHNENCIYVIAAAQNATPVHEKFLKSIETYCEVRNAELMVVPFRYRNPTSIWSSNEEKFEWWDSKISEFLVNDHIKLNSNLRLMGHIPITPTAVQPLSGFDSITGTDSGIFGHPSVQLKTVPTPANEIPKILSTTGAITVENYTDSKIGHQGSFNHSFSALVVEIKGDLFFMRHIHGNKDTGHFYDLDKLYTPSGVKDGQRAEALITGDIHAEFHSPDVEEATYTNSDSIMNTFRPKHWVLHDLEDFYPRNHHHANNDVIAFSKHHFGRDNVEESLQKSADFIDAHSRKGMTNIVVKSNHDEALDRWLIEANPKQDPENAVFYHYLKYHQYKSIRPTDVGFNCFDPFEFWCKNPESQKGLRNSSSTIFLKRDQSYTVCDIEVGFHGDRGPNGSRGSIRSFSKIGPKVVIGHSHSPGIFQGAYQVGVSARSNLSYVSGPSSWLQTHCIIYPDGSRTLLHVIKGQWKL